MLPTRTAIEFTMPDGTEVWIKTLNEFERSEAGESADFWAAKEARPYRESGDRYQDLLDKFEDEGDEIQATYLADSEWISGEPQIKAAEKYPDPPRPTRDTENDDAWMELVSKWEAERDKASDKRSALLTKQYEESKKRALDLQPATRLKRCARAWRERKYREKRAERYLLEVLWRAVRKADDHSTLMYPTVEAVRGLDDAAQTALLRAYFEQTDTVKPDDPPLSPTG